nr:MAG TPA: hypothetical protein [Caudoviricetes sp.]
MIKTNKLINLFVLIFLLIQLLIYTLLGHFSLVETALLPIL